jgi:hypothetical protein
MKKMKISNILIVTYLTILLAGTVFLFADDKRHYNKTDDGRRFNSNNIRIHEVAIDSPFSVIVGNEGSIVRIEPATDDKNKLHILLFYKNTEVPEIPRVQNDTLYIDKMTDAQATIACRNIKSIISKNSRVNLSLSGGTLDLTVEKSRIEIHDSHFDTINISSKSTTVFMRESKVNVINGSISNETSVNGYNSKIRKINLDISDDSHISK